MSLNSKIMAIKRSFRQRGGEAMKNTRNNILLKFKDDSDSSQALRYFAKVTLRNALPVFPALITISCEAVEGNAEKVTTFGEAIVLISAAADLHDDVIDQSLIKSSKQTVLGKFDEAIAILAGDILLSEGFKKLNEACELIPKADSKRIMGLVTDAVFEICNAETLEVQLRNKNDLKPDEYFEVIKLKAVVPELVMKIGAIVGSGNSKDAEKLGQYGRAYGIVSIIVEEFADLLDIKELRNRLKNECPPLPLIYSLQNPQIKRVLLPLLNADSLGKSVHEKIIEIVLDSAEVRMLQKVTVSTGTEAVKNLPYQIKGKIREELENMLTVPLAYFEPTN